jgi:phosphoribosylanthranilate isomerase
MRVKICGITRERDAVLAAELGAAAIGLVFWPASPRHVSLARARAIIARLPPAVTPVGVFVNQPLEDVRRIADSAGLGAVQLHGDEPLEYARGILQPVIKAIGVSGTFEPRALDAWPPEVTVLLDAHDPARRGGTGRPIDWKAAAAAAARRPIFLAGGLTPRNIAAAVSDVRPYGVDVSSGVEASPGIKDEARMRQLFAALEPVLHD